MDAPIVEALVEPPEAADIPQLTERTADAEEEPPPASRALTQLAASLRSSLQRVRTALAGAMAKLKITVSSAANACGRQARAFQSGFKLRATQAHSPWHNHLAEVTKKRAEAPQRAPVLEQQRQREAAMSAAAHQQELRERAALAAAAQQTELERIQAENQRLVAEIEHLRSEASEKSAALEQARLAAETKHQPQEGPAPGLQKVIKVVRRRNGQLRGAFAGAIAATFLFLVGMVLANFQAFTPVSHSLTTGSVEQQAPFGATTVHGPPGVTVVGTPKPTSASSTPPPQAQPAPAKPHPATRDSGWHHFQPSPSDQEGSTADDVVVKHFGPRRPMTQTAQQRQPGLKRYSDE
jgi:cell division protein FtsB